MPQKRSIEIAIIKLPGASNLSDFTILSKEENVKLSFIQAGDKIGVPDLLILPGTKNSIQDFLYLKREGYADTIRSLAKRQTMIMGISGGFQMLGAKVIDIRGNEQMPSKCDGLSFFNIVTRLMPSKVTSKVEFLPLKNTSTKNDDCESYVLSGYEMHLGRTKYLKGSQPLFKIIKRDSKEVEIFDGAVNKEGNIFGTYIHGIFDNTAFRKNLLYRLEMRLT